MEKNRIQTELERLKAAGAPVIDMIDTNFHRNGFRLPDEVLRPLFEEYLRVRSYEPDAKGDPRARESIAAYYAARAVSASPERVIITASASESYNLLFNTLAEPGDNILLPRPGYPLFEYLAGFNRLEARFYRMPSDERYRIDLDSLEDAADERTRAIVLISPNNPTGQIAEEAEIEGMLRVCERRGAVLISDEVFSEFVYGEAPSLPRPGALGSPVPVFTLNGISKMFASPDLKLGWMLATGEPSRTAELLKRLEIANDVYLSCSSLSQRILPGLFASAAAFTQAMVREIEGRRAMLIRALEATGTLGFVPPRGGIHCPVEIPGALAGPDDDEELALRLLRERHLYVHPGFFYGFEERPDRLFIVVSFLLAAEKLAEALARLSSFASGGR